MLGILQKSGEYLSGETALSVYWAFALAGTVIFVLSVLFHMLCGGVDVPGDVDMDMDGTVDIPHPDTGFPDLKFLSFRTILAFFTMFGWGGVVYGSHGWLGLLAALLCGTAMLVVTAFLIAGLMKLQQSGNIAPQTLVGKTGSVYLTVPAGRAAAGKVNLNLGTSTKEIQAFSETECRTGTTVRVLEYLGNGKFRVSPADENK